MKRKSHLKNLMKINEKEEKQQEDIAEQRDIQSILSLLGEDLNDAFVMSDPFYFIICE